MKEQKLWRLIIDANAQDKELAAGILGMACPHGWEEKPGENDGVIFITYGIDKENLEDVATRLHDVIPAVKTEISEIDAQDWNRAWRQFFTPVECGKRFVVLPPWLSHMEHSSRKPIIIDPKNAFGTGHHASTELCLTALSDLFDENAINRKGWFLDVGCGSGILGLAACREGMSGTGIDIDPDAIVNARENRELNELEKLELLRGDIGKVKNDKFDLIMANILAQPLIEMAPQLVAMRAEDCVLILGGILSTQAEEVATAYKKCGLNDPRKLEKNNWCALVWQ